MNQMKGYINYSLATLMKKLIDNKTAEDRPGRENEVEYCYYKDDVNKKRKILKQFTSLETHLLALRDDLNLYVMTMVPPEGLRKEDFKTIGYNVSDDRIIDLDALPQQHQTHKAMSLLRR